MKFSSADFKSIRWSIVSVTVAALVSGLLLFGSQQYADHAQKDFRTAQSRINNARARLNAARQDQEYLASYSEEYSILESRNIIGDEHRLDWMEGLDKLRRQNLVLDFDYNIVPQVIYSPQPAIDSGNLNINYSEMQIHFHLLHEGELLKFLNALDNQIKGHVQLSSCKVQRGSNTSGENSNEPPSLTDNIKAECSGGWITLKNRNAQP